MSKEFEQFLKEQEIPVFMFKMLPKQMQQDIENKYFELKKENENAN